LDLLRDSPSSNSRNSENSDDYVRDLREKLDEIHQDVRDRMEIKFNRVEGCYDTKARDCFSNKVKKFDFIILEEKKENF